MLSIFLVDEVFMYYFEKMLSTSKVPTGARLYPWTPLEDFHPSDPLISTSGKNPACAHAAKDCGQWR